MNPKWYLYWECNEGITVGHLEEFDSSSLLNRKLKELGEEDPWLGLMRVKVISGFTLEEREI